MLDNGVFRSDPVLRAAADGRLYYYSLRSQPNYHCQMFISTNFGATFTGPIEAYGGDKEWIAVDRTGGPGHGNVYAAWDFASTYAPFRFTRSADAGLTYLAPVGIPGNPDWGTSDIGPDGQFYVIGKSATSHTFARSTSPWLAPPMFDLSGPVNLGGINQFNIGTGPNPGGLSGQSWIVVDRSSGPRRGWLYALSSVKRPTADPLDVMFTRSTNGGQAWSAPMDIDDEPAGANAYQWFGTLSIAPSGRLDVLYNDTREGPGFQNSRLRYTYSTDGGNTWAPSEALTPSFNSHVGWPAQNKLGDYYDMESDDVGAFVAYAATFNAEQDVYFMRIGDYDCNRNGVGDTQDLQAGVLHDCDENAIPDECEIAAGTKADLNNNGIPDECECYADCNADGRLTVADFACFQTRFVLGHPYADCNGVGGLTVADFACFQTEFVAGCP